MQLPRYNVDTLTSKTFERKNFQIFFVFCLKVLVFPEFCFKPLKTLKRLCWDYETAKLALKFLG